MTAILDLNLAICFFLCADVETSAPGWPVRRPGFAGIFHFQARILAEDRFDQQLCVVNGLLAASDIVGALAAWCKHVLWLRARAENQCAVRVLYKRTAGVI